MFFSFNFHIYLLNSVAFCSVLFVKDCLWFAYLDLKSVSVNPTYVSFLGLMVPLGYFSCVETVAW